MVHDDSNQNIPISKTWDKMGEEQLKVYANELAEIYRQEKEHRQLIAAKNVELEKRVQELSALNAIFQKHLDMRFRTEEALKRLIDGINKLINEVEQEIQEEDSMGGKMNE